MAATGWAEVFAAVFQRVTMYECVSHLATILVKTTDLSLPQMLLELFGVSPFQDAIPAH